MSTSEFRALDGESELPVSAAELAALATQLFAASNRPGPDSPPQTVPVAPRGSVPDTTATTSALSATGGAANPFTPQAPFVGVPDIYVSAPTSPEPHVIPQTVPVAPRGSAPTWLPGAPSVADLGWSSAPPAVPPGAPVGDEAGYYFLTTPEPVPQLRDDHEVFDVNAIRADFPILRETVHGKPLIWFDNAATTQKPQAVIDRLTYFYTHENSNIHRAAHELAARATDAYEEARDTVRRFIGASKDEEIVFLRGTTEAINLVAYAWGGKYLGPGDEIVITHLEHHANIVPWQLISQQTGAILKV
ncbi:MAG TPA: aminotransferase class V-fold PLP-dependent enzyme, partial [Mycobacterium sp.]|nr:aminotransferase class V-fold PLP-dependent enzyme [Mycobacterium sp.]